MTCRWWILCRVCRRVWWRHALATVEGVLFPDYGTGRAEDRLPYHRVGIPTVRVSDHLADTDTARWADDVGTAYRCPACRSDDVDEEGVIDDDPDRPILRCMHCNASWAKPTALRTRAA